jgi:hypothetical protein
MADASWGERNIYGILIMMNNGVIVAETKKMGPVDSSAEAIRRSGHRGSRPASSVSKVS